MSRLSPALVAALVIACGDPRPVAKLPPVAETAAVIIRPASLRLSSGQSRQLVAQANGADGSAIGGADIQYQSLNPGIAAVTSTGLVTAVGPRGQAEVSATSGSATARVTINVSAGEPESIVVKSTGEYTGNVGDILSEPVEVVIKDAKGNAVPGVVVDFHLTASGGAVEPPRTVTGPDGVARGLWALGPRAGRQLITAQIEKLPDLLVSVAAVAAPGPPATVASNLNIAEAISGKATELRLQVADAFKNPVESVELAWTASSGKLEIPSAKTTASGIGQAVWKPDIAGPAEIKAAVAGSSLQATWKVVVKAGEPAKLVAVAGDGQAGRPLSKARVTPTVRVEDARGNAVTNAAVSFRIAEGGGSVGEGSVLTDTGGIAAPGAWLFGAAGKQVLEATAAGISGSVQFAAELRGRAPRPR